MEAKELLGIHHNWESEEDDLKETIKRWLDDPSTKDREKLEYILKKIEEIDKTQDEILEKILLKLIHMFEINRESNNLWKQYDVQGRYGMPKRAFYAPLFNFEVHRRWGTWKVTQNSYRKSTK
ncbi:hypothetical protein [Thermosipho melanesiensis]|uniref:hypothetical protein n=1 Tax=Thermosipho melanesiensis TaxID=46541 RepID=UPI0015D66571|nr:hypothetical protein [Thermosipho melanesiensis]